MNSLRARPDSESYTYKAYVLCHFTLTSAELNMQYSYSLIADEVQERVKHKFQFAQSPRVLLTSVTQLHGPGILLRAV